jgi:ribonuclease J
VVILCTGSQGEVNAALSRMASGDHPHVKIKATDTVILSSNPIGGNVVAVGDLVDQLMREGAKVYQGGTQAIDGAGLLHTSGHAFRDDIGELIEILQPKFLMPIHGTFAMQVRHAEVGVENGVAKDNIFVLDIGDVLELTADAAKKGERVPSGVVYVDGAGVGDVENLVLRDRMSLGSEGMMVIVATVDKKSGRLLGSPDIISRGFVHMKESGTGKVAQLTINIGAVKAKMSWPVHILDYVGATVGGIHPVFPAIVDRRALLAADSGGYGMFLIPGYFVAQPSHDQHSE